MPATPRQAAANRKTGTRFLSEVVADNARQLRSVRELSQDAVAERMRALGHSWSRQTTSDVEHADRNVTVDELLGLAIVLGAPISDLLDSRGVLRSYRWAVDAGDPDLPFAAVIRIDDATLHEVAGTAGIGIPPGLMRALIEGRMTLSLVWDDGPVAIGFEPVLNDGDEFQDHVEELLRRGTESS